MLFLIILLFPLNCFGTDVIFDVKIKPTFDYNSNLFLSYLPHNEVYGSGVDTVVNSTFKKENIETNFSANLNQRTYIDDEKLNYFNQFFNMKSNFLFNKNKLGLNAQYNFDTSSAVMDDPNDEIGFVFMRIPKKSRMIQPNYSYDIFNNAKLNLAYKYRDIEYDSILKLTPSPFPDTIGHTTTADINYKLFNDFQIIVSYFHKNFLLIHPKEIIKPIHGELQEISRWKKEIATELFTLGVKYKFDHLLNFEISAGLQNNSELSQSYNISESEIIINNKPSIKGNTFSEIYSIQINKKMLNMNDDFTVNHSRSILPNPSGILIQYDKTSAIMTHTFSPTWYSKINLSYANRSYPLVNKKDTIVGTIQTNLGWKFLPDFELVANYQYSTFNDQVHLDNATSNSISLNINYNFNGMISF